MLFSLVSLAAAAAAVSDKVAAQAWKEFVTKYNKVYAAEEMAVRYTTFVENLRAINHLNNQKLSYRVAVNEFADLSNAEFVRLYTGLKYNALTTERRGERFVPDANVRVPASVDWRKKGAVTGVKNQGQCGSCWSFSATGSMEGQHFLSKQGALVGLSEQNLVDCSTAQGNQGCDGGLMDDAFEYVISNGGIDSESSYPYTATGPNQCEYKASARAATISGYSDIESGNETALTIAIATVGPISVAIDASQTSFQFYDGGVYYSYFCSSTQLDHGVLAVGYGTDSGTAMYIVKNSWGDSWGDGGYLEMIRNWDNNCGIATAASFPKV